MDKKDFQNWQDMWEKAMDEDVPTPAATPPEQQSRQVYFNNPSGAADPPQSDNSSVDKEYWDQIYKASMHPGDSPDPLQAAFGAESEILTEKAEDMNVTTPKPVAPNQSKDELGDIAKTKANAANPIDPGSIGKDQDYKPNLADAHQLEQLHNLKINLYELECKLNTNDCLAKTDKGKKIQNQIDALKTHIDELSDTITPDFLQSYLS